MAAPKPSPPPEPRRLELTPEDLAKVATARGLDQKASIDPEWRAIAEFGTFYGFDAVMAVLNNEISADEMTQLILGARDVQREKNRDTAQAVFVASVSAQSKKPQETFNKLIKQVYKAK